MRRVLVHLYHPGNALGALSSVLWYGRAKGLGQPEVTLLLSNPCAAQDKLEEMAGIIARLCAGQGWPRPRVLAEAGLADLIGGETVHAPGVLGRFQRLLGHDDFEEVHIVHDVSGPISEMILHAYPKARSITFGDALGALYNAPFHRALYDGQSEEACQAVGRNACQVATAGDGAAPKTIVALLPTDQTGDCLAGKELLVPPREVALEIIEAAGPHLGELHEHCRSLVRSVPEPRFFCTLETLVEAGFASHADTLALQEDIISRHIPKGAGIILKPHPLSTNAIHLELAERLASRYGTACVGEAFWRYPLEFMTPLLEHCRLLCWSYGTLSISYLLGKKIEHAIDADLIRRYIREDKRPSMFNSMRLIREPLDRLGSWDGQGPLWSGGYASRTEL